MTRAFVNPSVRRDRGFRGLFDDEAYRDVAAYFAAYPEPETPLRSLTHLAASLGVGEILVKDETSRFGLNAFKIVGVRYAVHRLGAEAVSRGLVCGTAGNHGRAVARVARENGVACTVFVPAERSAQPAESAAGQIERRTRRSRLEGMRADEATVVEVHGSYEDAVRCSSEHAASSGATIVSDTSWPGYQVIPRWIMAGYTQVFEEAKRQWDQQPGVLLVQGGVGGLVCAAASWNAWRFGPDRPFLVACEPDQAACLLESARAGHPISLPGDLPTMMAGLRCAEPSPLAWAVIKSGVDAFLAIPDSLAFEALEQLRTPVGGDAPIDAGASGACGAAALIALARSPEAAGIRALTALDRSTTVLIVVTEGA
jgi:diaminopropionate ammonia-lyase